MTIQTLVREAAQEDVDGVVALEQTIATAPHWSAGAYSRAVSETDRCLLIAEQDGLLAGFAAVSLVDEEGELETVAVRPDAREQGLGAALVRRLLVWFAGRGGRVMRLEVRAGSLAAQRLYYKLGFVETGRRRAYYHAPEEDALILCWRRAGDGEV